METSKKKLSWWKKTLIIFGSTIMGIISLALITVLSFNLIKFGIYSDYYSIRENVCINPGLNDNFVSQGTAITNDGKIVITCGYMSDKTNSRIYIIDTETNATHKVDLVNEDGSASKGHFGGVAESNKMLYLATSGYVWSIDLYQASKSETIEVKKLFEVNNRASYIFTDDTYLYVGEYYDKGKYETGHTYEYNDVTYNAIVSKYELANPGAPLAVYAVRNNVQGFAMDENGNILLSTSFGLTSSQFYYYKNSSIVDTGDTLDGAPLYVLETADLQVSGPAMSEDLDYLNGKFYTNFESACNKYVFGKFFVNSDQIVALDFNKLLD